MFPAMRAQLSVAAFLVICGCGPSHTKDKDEGLMSIAIEPANATITYAGTPVTLDYKAIGHFEDGSMKEIPDAVFALDTEAASLGNLNIAQFEATGAAAGKGGVLAQAGDIVGGTSVAVIIHPVHVGPGVPAGADQNFPDNPPMGAMSPTVVYPLEGAIMPSSVKSPDVQWEGSNAAGELYRVRITAGQFATVDTILAAGPTFKLDNQVSDAEWRMLVKSAGTGPVTIDVAHWSQATSASGGVPRTVRMVPGDITGAIYYWNLGAGEMEKIDALGRSKAIKSPPMQPSTGSRCVACHTVSKDGRYLSGSLWGGGLQGGVFDMSDPGILTNDPAPTLAPVVEGSTYTQLFSTFNADASRLMINVGIGSFYVIDPRTGATVPTTGVPLPTSGASHPAWSPDGTAVAFINNITSGGGTVGWAIDYDRGDLQIMSSAGDSFGAPTNLVAAASVDPAFIAPSWPSFSPDSQWIVYGAGNNSRGENGPARYPGSLFLVNRNGGASVRLDIACGGARTCYLPNFSPYDTGGYLWLVYYSFRDYGNSLAGTKGSGRRQMWITAIDKSKLGQSTDASSVSYWVPDQDSQTPNMSAFWAPPPPIQ
jgi:hypothetical protein